ncbi:MAG: hypothetical protein JWO70_4568 [Betaproteobacteria bacterium]|jgi:uncharacterized protein (DUF488 family)|nr:hypothetical protein [Betaproteobacteria bacterium]
MPTAPAASQSASPIYTIGHGNRPLAELAELLKLHSVSYLVDVRAFPGSRRHPHFGREALERSLPEARVRYVWEGKALGGRRRAKPDSPHVALRNDSFRAYADHMESGEFQEGIGRLLAISASERPAIMCAERLPWQCHRFMISDYLVAAGIEVLHVIDASAPRAHTLRAEVRLSEGQLIYDGQTQSELGLD